MSYLQTHYHFKLDFQNMDQHTGGKWLIHGTNHHKHNQLQRLEPPVEYPSRHSKYDIKESEGNIEVRSRRTRTTESLKCSSK